MTQSILRGIAIVIAVAGLIDPAVTTTRRTTPDIAVVASDAGHEALARRVAEEVDGPFTVIRAPFPGAAGTVIVGRTLPPASTELASPVFAVIPAPEAPTVDIEAVSAPTRVGVESRVPVAVTARVRGAGGRRLAVVLRAGDLVVDRIVLDIDGSDATVEGTLDFVPPAPGPVRVRATASIEGSEASAAADAVIDVAERRWAVLFFDPRPSWMSTFVRRAVEADPRFVVTSRVVTSRGVSTDVGRPPATLDDRSVAAFDVIVVGAPDALVERDVSGLEAHLRRRGATVVLLLDGRGDGPYRRLTRVGAWEGATVTPAVAIKPLAADSGLRASELAWPAELPAGARVVAASRPAAGRLAESRPVVWRLAVGAGRLVVSGALDSWRFRDPAVSPFDSLWRTVIAEGAGAAPPPISIALANQLAAPGEPVEITATLRDVVLRGATAGLLPRASIGATLEAGGARTPIRLWPDGMLGRFRGSFRAPDSAGTHRVVVASDGLRDSVPLVVWATPARPQPDHAGVVAAWVGSRGGATVSAAELDELPRVLRSALQPAPRRVTWHPMRSAWWIIPFAFLLGVEWLWRRRRGLA